MAGYVDSEVGRLRTVLLHRPGAELKRLTPRNNDQLLFDGIPWVDRAQEEHDGFAQALRDHGVEVLYLGELLEQALVDPAARESTIAAVLDDPRLGPTLRAVVAPAPARPAPGRPGRGAHGRADPAGAEDRPRADVPADGRARLRRRPAAQPAVHPRLVGVDPGRGRGDQPVDDGAPAGGHAAAGDLRGATPGSPAPRPCTSRSRSGWRAATCCCSARACSPSAPASGPRRPGWRRWPAGCSPRAWRTRCWWCRSRRSGRPCTSTRSARWSTSTRSRSTRRSPTRSATR